MKKKQEKSYRSVLYYIKDLRWHILFFCSAFIGVFPTQVLIFVGLPSVFFLLPAFLYLVFNLYRVTTQPRKRHLIILLLSFFVFYCYFQLTTISEIQRICTTQAVNSIDTPSNSQLNEVTKIQYVLEYRQCKTHYMPLMKKVLIHFEYYSMWQTLMRKNITSTQ